jgi:integrase/recombinase XerC
MGEDAGVQAYLDHLAQQRLASAHTLAAYRRDLKLLRELLDGADLAQAKEAQLRRGLMQLHGRGLAPRSLARVLSAWRGYYGWLVKRGEIGGNPCIGLKAPKRPRPLPKALSPDQARLLLEAEGDDLLQCRDKAMFELFYSSGLRLAELAGLDLDAAVDWAEGEVTVTGKRRKSRTVPVGEPALHALRQWLGQRPEIAAVDEVALFVGRGGKRLSPRSIERRLAAWASRSGLGLHVHPHMLRHSFASHLLQSSGDLRAVQELLGHASIAATQVYTHLDYQHLAKVYDAAHPRARKK